MHLLYENLAHWHNENMPYQIKNYTKSILTDLLVLCQV